MNTITFLTKKISSFFTTGHKRSQKAKLNIVASLGIRGVNILIGFYLVPLTLNYLNETKYGIWLTLSSVIGWFTFFDIGLGNGLRNKFAVSMARDQDHLAKTYVSTTYALILVIMVVLFLIFNAIHPFLNWAAILNADPALENELNSLAYYVFAFFCLQFVLKLIGSILLADQLPAANNLMNFASQLISLIVVIILINTTEGSLLLLGVTISAAPVLVFLLASVILFRTKYKAYVPDFKSVDFKEAKTLMNFGLQFFIIQIAAVVLFATDNMIITQILGPESVTPYSIAYKCFGMFVMVFTIVMSPFWSSFTEAYEKKEYQWIKNVINKLLRFWFLFTIPVLVMLLLADTFYEFWVGEEIIVPFSLSLSMALFAILQSFNLIFVNFINGVGKLRLQLMTGIFSILVNVPLSILFAKEFGLGATGVILATITSILISIVLRVIQYRKIIENRAVGLWNK